LAKREKIVKLHVGDEVTLRAQVTKVGTSYLGQEEITVAIRGYALGKLTLLAAHAKPVKK
jgi:hypothetical protein